MLPPQGQCWGWGADGGVSLLPAVPDHTPLPNNPPLFSILWAGGCRLSRAHTKQCWSRALCPPIPPSPPSSSSDAGRALTAGTQHCLGGTGKERGCGQLELVGCSHGHSITPCPGDRSGSGLLGLGSGLELRLGLGLDFGLGLGLGSELWACHMKGLLEYKHSMRERKAQRNPSLLL